MKKIILAATFAVFASTQAFAIVGAGAHYVMNMGSLKGSKGSFPATIQQQGIEQSIDIDVNQKKADGLQGIGFKAWIDFLPLVDIEGTLNIAATRYTTVLSIPSLNKDIPLEYAPEAPYSMLFDKASPLYGIVTGDLSVTYPFDMLPIIRPYVGAGVSYLASIPIVNSEFTKKIITAELVEGLMDDDPKVANKAADKIVEKLTSEYNTGIGGHIIAGFRIKPPIIPIAAYLNGKYYFGGDLGKQFSNGFVLEVGGGFAI